MTASKDVLVGIGEHTTSLLVVDASDQLVGVRHVQAQVGVGGVESSQGCLPEDAFFKIADFSPATIGK